MADVYHCIQSAMSLHILEGLIITKDRKIESPISYLLSSFYKSIGIAFKKDMKIKTELGGKLYTSLIKSQSKSI